MKIQKVLNNNVITTIDKETGLEMVVMGRGIAFKKKAGQDVDESKVEKVFLIQNQKENKKFQSLVNEIPLEYIKISENIINYAKDKLQTEFDDHIHVALTDHIAFAIKRTIAGLENKNHLLWEIQRIHPREYEIGLWAIEYIEKEIGVKMPEDEAGFIALHIINASLGEDMADTFSITNIVQDILNIIKYYFKMEFDENSISYSRLLTHLKYFAQRVLSKKQSEDDNPPFYDQIKKNYKKYYDCALKIKEYISKNYDYEIGKEEIVYLCLHLQRVVNR